MLTTHGLNRTPRRQVFKVKILMLGDDENPQAVRVELTSEADLFFHYMHELDEHGFAVGVDGVSSPLAWLLTRPAGVGGGGGGGAGGGGGGARRGGGGGPNGVGVGTLGFWEP
jgi:hypothetical protein